MKNMYYNDKGQKMGPVVNIKHAPLVARNDLEFDHNLVTVRGNSQGCH